MNLPAKLRQLASQENHDGEPYDSLIEAAAEIDRLSLGHDVPRLSTFACFPGHQDRPWRGAINGPDIAVITDAHSREGLCQALAGQYEPTIQETPRTDAEEGEFSPSSDPNYDGPSKWVPSYVARELERENIELRQVVAKILAERDRLNGALQTLINLNDGRNEGGDGITGEDWEIASYALIEQL